MQQERKRSRWSWDSASDQMVRDRRSPAKKKSDDEDFGLVWAVLVIVVVLIVVL